MEITEKNKILNHIEVSRKIRRMAFEIYEQNFEENDIIIAGIKGMGNPLAEMLCQELKKVSPIHCTLDNIALDKKASIQSEVRFSLTEKQLTNKSIIIVDDVLNTGKTIVHSLKPFLKIPVRKLQVAVLVNRGHRSFPVSPDFVGYELSTTVNQHIEVDLTHENNLAVYLF